MNPLRVLGIGDWNDLGDLYRGLLRDGHEALVHVADPTAHDILEGLVPRVDDWRDHLGWIREAGKDGMIVFETAHHGSLQDDLRAKGYQVVGGSAFGDRLENERGFGQRIMEEAGLRTVPSWMFSQAEEAIHFIREHPGRYVLKFDALPDLVCSTFPGRSPTGDDVVAILGMPALHHGKHRILLTRFVSGVEVGIGGYFNGRRFLTPTCLDWEHKRFFPGDLGELTGEMGTLVTYRCTETLFDQTLARFTPWLAAAGHVGYINLNTIINDEGVWPLEFTSRFGYPGFAILDALHPDGWGDLLRRVLDPNALDFAVSKDYALGVVVTVPPFPYPDGYERLSKGMPITIASYPGEDGDHFHLAEVAERDGVLVCAGQIGYPMVVTGTGIDAAAAKEAAYRRVERVTIPHMRYRLDIGEAYLQRDRQRLIDWGYLTSQC